MNWNKVSASDPLIQISTDFITKPTWGPLAPGPLELPPHPRILIVKLSAIGDCLVASPVARALRERYPTAHIAWAVQAKASAVVEGNPNLNEVLVWRGDWRGALRLGRQVRARQFDAVLDLQGALKSAPLLAMSGARHRVVSSRAEGVARRAANFVVAMPSPPPHASEQYLRLSQALDTSPRASRQLQMPVGEAERRWVADFLAGQGVGPDETLVALNPGAARPIKQWPPAQFAALGTLLAQKGMRVIIPGGPGDAALAQEIVAQMMGAVKPVVAAGKTNLKQLGALLERCALLVSADTGPMHIAAGVKTPIVALFGPTDPTRTGPVGQHNLVVVRDLPCRPCMQRPTCDHFECLTEMQAGDVFHVVTHLLGTLNIEI